MKEKIIILRIRDIAFNEFQGTLDAKGFKNEEEVNRYLLWWIWKKEQAKRQERLARLAKEKQALSKMPWWKRFWNNL